MPRAFGVVLLEPFVRGDGAGKHLEMIGVAGMVSNIDVNPNGCHRMILKVLAELCVLFVFGWPGSLSVGPLFYVRYRTDKKLDFCLGFSWQAARSSL
jgi:hypothetical protein